MNTSQTISKPMKPYALVTGASSGIGYEYAKVLAEHGYNLIVVSNEDSMTDRARQISMQYPDIDVVPCVKDLGTQSAARELYEWVKEQDMEVEVLINNAGVYHFKDFLEDTEAFNTLILNLHMHTLAMLCYYFAKDMVSRHKGYIINMSSITSDYGIQRLATYSSTKGFVRLFSRSLHVELKAQGVNVTCVRPGAVATPLYNLNPTLQKIGLTLGFIITPQRLAKKGVRAMFAGKSSISPGIFTKILGMVAYIPICVLKPLRRWV